MSVAKVLEVIAQSDKSFDDAIRQGISRTTNTITNVTGAWIKDKSVVVSAGKIVEYRVIMKVTFVVKD